MGKGGEGLPVIKYLASILLRNTCQDTGPTDDVVEGTDHRAQKRIGLCTRLHRVSRNSLDMLLRIFPCVETNIFYSVSKVVRWTFFRPPLCMYSFISLNVVGIICFTWHYIK